MENMNTSDGELLINKIGKYLPFIYPTYGVYKILFFFFFASLANILHATIAITIIKSWRTSDCFNSSYFKVVVFGSFIYILNKYLKENANIVHLVIWAILRGLLNWTYNIQNMNLLLIAIIRFLSVFYSNSYYQYIDKNYLYFQISMVIYSAIVPLLYNTSCSLPYRYSRNTNYNGGKRGGFNCKYPFGFTEKEHRFILIALVHSVVVISIILTIIITFKIKKLSKISNEFSVIAIKKRNKEKRMTVYVIIIGISQLICLIQDQFHLIKIKINGYDESIKYIIRCFEPFVGVFWIFFCAISIISISTTLRDAVFKNLKLDIIYMKLFRGNVVAPISHNPNTIQNMNRDTKKKIII